MNRVGNQNPTFRACADYDRTEGIYAVEMSECYALKPHPWQELVLNDWLAVDDDGKLIHSFCVLEVPRQNGKTGVSDPRETWGLIKRKESILHTAQEYQTAKKAFDRLRKKFGAHKGDPYAEFPELNALVDHYTVSAGQMVLDLTNGAHIEFRTRGNNSDMGRGGTFDLVVIDEAQTYTEEQDAALSPLNSAAPTGSPQTILMGTPPLTAGSAKGVVFARAVNGIKEKREDSECAHIWGVDDVGDIHDINRWYAVNPSLGYQLIENAIAKDAAKMADDMFAREHLGFFPRHIEKISYAIPADVWDACRSAEMKPEGKTAYGVKFSPDGSAVCLCGAVIPEEGTARVSMIEYKSTAHGTQWLADWLVERYSKASCVVIDGRNGVDVLVDKIADTWRMKESIVRPSVKDVIAAVGMLTDALNEQTITWYEKQDALRESAVTSTKRSIGKAGGWAFGGENSLPIEACALAFYGAKTSKRNPNKRMRIG